MRRLRTLSLTNSFLFSILIITAIMFLDIGPTAAASTPEQVHLSWTSDPSTTITAMWHTDSSSNPTQVQYGVSPSCNTFVSPSGQTFPSTGSGYLHEVRLTGLSSGTTYCYQVTADDGSWSASKSFKTAPSSSNYDFRFLAAADMGKGNANSIAVSGAMADSVVSRGAGFTVGAGDYWYVAHSSESGVDEWFVQNEPHMSRAPFMPTVGNHEVDPNQEGNTNRFPTRFSLPPPENYYSFRYGGAHFIMINTNVDFSGGSPQRVFIELDLLAASSDPSVDWIFAVLHHPPFASNSDFMNLTVRQELSPRFDFYGVDVVITGHAHFYERTYPVYANETRASSDGSRYTDPPAPIYMVTGGGGASPDTSCGSKRTWSVTCQERTYEFLEFHVTPDRIVLWSTLSNGTAFDGFTLEAPGAPNSAPVLIVENQSVDELNPLSFTANANDPDGDFLTFSLGSGAPQGASITPRGAFSWTPTEAQGPGSYPVTIIVSDGELTDSETITITVREANTDPALSPIGNKNINEETVVTFTSTATDADLPAQSLTFSLGAGAPAGASITAAGVFSWTPTEAQGPNSYTIIIQVTDSFGGSDSETITVTVNEVNRPPVLDPVGNKSSGEETALSFTATASDPDIPAQALTFTLGLAPTGNFPTGATITSSGVFTWTPTEAQGPGTYSARITVFDSLETDFEDIIITVTEVNKPPILTDPGPQTADEGSVLSFSVSATDPDIPANTVTLACTNCAAIGASFDPATGQFFWTPSEAQGPGSYTVSFTATDDGVPSRSGVQTVSVTVNEVNQAPTLEVIPDQLVDEEATLTVNSSASDPDLPPQPLTFTLSGTASGATVDSATGVFTWTPAENQGPGAYSATITVTDSYGGSDSRTFTITVLDVNKPPVLTVPAGQIIDEEFTLNFAITATDPDIPSNAVSLSVSGLPEGATFDPATGIFSWTPTEVQGPGTYTVSFTAIDDGSPSFAVTESVTITVKEVNRAPVLNPIGNQTVNEQTFLRFTATASDTDFPSQTLTFSLGPNPPAGASITPDGSFAWSPSEMRGPGTAQVTIIISDGSLVDSETVIITINEVNKPPVLVVPGTQTVDEGVLLTFVINWTDPDLPANVVVLSCENCAALGATFDPATGTFSWTPSEAQGPLVYKVNFTATDNGTPVLSDLKTVTIAVGEVGSPPSLDPIGLKTGDEESLVSFTVTASDPDLPAQTLTFSMSSDAPAGATIDPSTGVFTWVPSESQGPGIFSFTITVSDETQLDDSELVTIEVYEVNTAPVLAPVGALGIDEEKEFRFTLLATDHDLPAQILSFSQEEASGLFPIGATMSPEGLFTWTPSELQGPGVYTVRIIVSDGVALNSTEVIINVGEVNKRPVLEPINSQVSDEKVLLTFTAVASDPDSPPNTLFFALGPDRPEGASIDPVTGVFRWTPSENQGPGVYTISVFAIDSGSPSMSDLRIVPMTVKEVNERPVLAPVEDKAVQEERELSFTLSASDPDDPVQPLTFSSLSLPAGSIFQPSTGVFSWTPSEEQGPGSYTATFEVSDGLLTAEMTVNIVVNEFNLPPSIVVAPTQTVDEKFLLTFTVRVVDLDAPENLLEVSATNLPLGASFDQLTRSFSWTPDEVYGPGTYLVTFTVADNGIPILSDMENVTITVLEVNESPVVMQPGNQTIDEETPLALTVNAFDPDIPAQTLTFSLGTGSPDGVSVDSSTGMFSWVPAETHGPGVYSITLIVSDGSLAGSQTFSVTVRDVNEIPILNTIGNKTVNEQTVLTFNATASDTDFPSQTLTFSLGPGQPVGASITPAGVFTWSPSETRGPGTTLVTVIVSDGLLIASENVTITINEVNKAPVLDILVDKSANEESLLTFAVTANDVDLPANVLSFSLAAGSPAGASIDASTGVFLWTPSEDQGPGTYVITIIVTDNGVPTLSHSQTVTINVGEVNRAPVLVVPGVQTVGEGTRLAFVVISTDPDIPANILTLSASGVPGGALFDPGTGTLVWTPIETQGPGNYTVTFLLSDGVLTHLDSVRIAVLEVNRAPSLTVPDSQTVDERSLLTFTISAQDPDVPANAVTLTANNLPVGAFFDPLTGRFSWTPDETQGLSDFVIGFTATDNGSPPLASTRTVIITVREVNQAPVLAPIGDKTADEEATIGFIATGSDSDLPPQTLTFSLATGAPAGSSIDTVTGSFSWSPSEAMGPGNYLVTIIVSDGSATDSETITINVREINKAPVVAPIGDRTVDERTQLTFTVTASDPDIPAQVFTLSAEGLPLGATFNPTSGRFSWTPSETQGPGTFTVTFRVSDSLLEDSETVAISVSEVNSPPTVLVALSHTVIEETQITFTVAASDPDIPGNILTLSASGMPQGAIFDPLTGTFSWTPSETQGPGIYAISFTAVDNGVQPLSDAETVTISVGESNRAPVLSAVGDRTVNEQTTITFQASASDSDVPAQTLTFSLGPGAPTGATIDASTGVFSWIPSESRGPGTYPVTVIVSDSILTHSETITITVNETNQAPVLATIGDKTVNELILLTFFAAASDSDIPAQTLTFQLLPAPSGGFPEGASITSTGVFSWTPSEAQGPGTYQVTIAVTDGFVTDSETILILVNEACCLPPVLSPIEDMSVDEGRLLTFTATASDGDIPAQTLTFSLGTGAPSGAFITTNGVFSWTPSEAQGPAILTVTIIVSDGSLTDSETVTVTVFEVNRAPEIVVPGAQTVNEGTTLTFTITATDPDTPSQQLALSAVSVPLGANFNPDTGEFSWIPSEAQGPGSYTATFQASDGSAADVESVSITVREVNQAPVLAPIGPRNLDEETTLAFNATASDSDQPLQTLTFTIGAGAPTGATIDPNRGTFSWTPSEDRGPGDYPVTIIVSDGAATDSETITISVRETNKAPLLGSIGGRTVDEGTLLTFTLSASDPDLPAQAYSFSAEGPPSGATLNPTTGKFSWTPSESHGVGTFTVTFTVSDGSLTDSETVAITVNEVNKPPILSVASSHTVVEETQIIITAVASDPDIPANALTFSVSGMPGGAFFDPATGTFSWTPSEAQGPGNYAVSFIVVDNGVQPLSDTETVTIIVLEANLAPVLDPVRDKVGNEQTTITFQSAASDPDIPAQTITFSLGPGAPTGATINTSTGVFTWIPSETRGPGTYPVTIIVSDGLLSDTETITITVNETNQPPTLATIGEKTINELTLLTFVAVASDSDIPVQTLTFALSPSASGIFPDGASISEEGIFSWTPSEAQGPGSYRATIVVSDGSLTDSETILIVVNEACCLPPALTAIDDMTIDERILLLFTATASDGDIPAQTLTFSLGPGSPGGASIDSVTGVFTWTPTETQGPGSYTISIIVSDGTLTDSETFIVNVNETNRSPSINGVGAGSQIVDEETFLSLTITTSDPDIPENLVVLSASDLPAGATFDPLTHRFTWTPSEAQGPGTYTVIFTATDDGTPSLSTTKTVTIVVNEVNTAPRLILPGDQTITEGSLLTFTVTALDSDLPTNIIALSVADIPESGAFNSQTGSFTWTPSESQGPGIFTIKFTATDNGTPPLFSTISLKVTVQEINTAPTLQDIGNKTVNEQTLLSFTARASDVDIPTPTLLFSLDPGITAATITADGVFSWSPSEARGPGVYQITITVSDGLVTDSETIFVTVNEVNTPPELDPIGIKSIVEGNTLTFVASASDHDIPSQNLAYSLGSNAPEGASITLQGVFSWTPSEAQGPGSFQIIIIVSDGSLNDSETILVTVNEAGTFPPVLNPIGDQAVDEGTFLRFNATASDADIPPQTLTFSASSLPPGANIDPATGTFTWTPTESQGPRTYSVTIIVSDGSMTDSEVITLTVNEVNRSPSMSVPGSQTVEENIALSFVITATDPDSPANSITFSASNMPQGATFDPVTGRFTWAPTEEQGPGSYVVTFVATDDGIPSLSASKSVAITVNETNQEPVLTNIGDKVADEESLLTFTASSIDSDIPRNSLVYSLGSGAPAGSTIDPVTGVFSWSPSESQGPGLYSVTIIVTDSGSPAKSDSETIAITVREANRPPILIPVGDKTGNEQTLLTFTVTATDADIPANTLTFTLGPGAPSGAAITSAGVFAWTPTEAQGPSIIAITIIVSDGSLTSSQTLTISINEVNRSPSLTVPSSQSVEEGALLTFAIASTDPDIPVNTLTLSVSSLLTGATFDPVAGTFSWTPSETQGPGTYSVRFTVADNGLPALNSTKTVTITINELNSPPRLILPGEQTVIEGSLLAFAVTASDPDVPVQTLTLSSISLPTGASFDPGTGIFSWTPAEGVEPGTYPATLKVSDGSLTDTQTVMITVVEVNQPPVLSPVGNKSTDEEKLLRFNVTATDPDIPAQTLTFSLGGGAPTGASITSRGTFSWTPAEIQGPATHQVTIIVTDGNATDSETIAITVAEVNRAPIVSIPGQQTVREGQQLTFGVSGTDPDSPANNVIISTSSLPTGASFDATTGLFSWTPSEAQGPAILIVSFTATDNGTPTLSNTKSLTIQIDEVNEAPVLSPIGNKAVDERTRLSFTVTASDSDLPIQALRFSLLFDGEPIGASVDSVTGEFTWVPSESRGPGSFQVTIVVSDQALMDSETITITVNEVNAAPVLDTIGPKTVDEGILLTFTAGASDSDIPAQILPFSLGPNAPEGASITPAGVFSWIPSETQGPDTFQVTISVSDGSLTDSETITITVNELQNSVPVLAPIGHKTINEGTEHVFIVSATDADVPVQALTFSVLDLPTGATFDASTGRFSWTPSETQGPGTYTLAIRVTDDGSPPLSDSETITITVREVNTPPVLAPIGNQAVNEQTSITFAASATDPDLPTQQLVFSIFTDASLGAAMTTDGVFSWTPSESRGPGSYLLIITVFDGSLADSESITLTVLEVNRAPEIEVPLAQAVNEETSLTFTITATDPDIPSQPLTLAAVSMPLGASFNVDTGEFSWIPSEAQGQGSYTATFQVSDGSAVDVESVSITVKEVNTGPKLDPVGDKTVNEQTRLTFQVSAIDPDGPQVLTFGLGANVPQGASIDSRTGVFSWTPSEARGPDNVQVTIIVYDEEFTDSQTITITVNEVNSAPVLNDIGPKTVGVGEILSFTVTASDGDTPVQSLSFSMRQAPTDTFPQGATITPDGVFSWTTAGQASGTYRVRIVVSDGLTETFDDLSLTVTGGQGAISLAFQPDWIPWFSLGLGVPLVLAIVFRSLGKNHKRPI